MSFVQVPGGVTELCPFPQLLLSARCAWQGAALMPLAKPFDAAGPWPSEKQTMTMIKGVRCGCPRLPLLASLDSLDSEDSGGKKKRAKRQM